MAHQSPGGGFGNAHPVSFDTIKRAIPPEQLDTNPSEQQPPGVDVEYESLEEALTS